MTGGRSGANSTEVTCAVAAVRRDGGRAVCRVVRRGGGAARHLLCSGVAVHARAAA